MSLKTIDSIFVNENNPLKNIRAENAKMNADDLFTAPQVAKICSTDLKTIHNWVNRGEIKSFRTPGRHLRFRRQDVLEFLGKFGYPVPDGFSPTRMRVVLFEEDENVMRSIKKVLVKDFEVEAYSDQVDTLLAIGQNKPNLVLVHDKPGKKQDNLGLVTKLTAKKDICPVAVYSDNEKNREAAQKAGALDFIPSVDGKEIRKRLSTLLGV